MFHENNLEEVTSPKEQTSLIAEQPDEKTISLGIRGKLKRFSENKQLMKVDEISKVSNVFFNKDKKQRLHPLIELKKGERVKGKNSRLFIEFPYEAVFSFKKSINNNK